MRLRVLRFLLRKEFLQIVRDRTLLGMLFIMPVIRLLVLANAVTFEVKSSDGQVQTQTVKITVGAAAAKSGDESKKEGTDL